jgi:signal transduction histidine kinase
MAELHGGTISIESTEGEGMAVTLRFPKALVDRV